MTSSTYPADDKPRLEPQIRRRLVAGLLLATALVGGLGGWGAFASISSAIVAPGVIVVEGSDKKVQHPTGGVIGAILVKNGDVVQAGDVLVRLDPTQAAASLGVITAEQTQLEARQARLHAERDATDQVVFPSGFLDRSPELKRSPIVNAACSTPGGPRPLARNHSTKSGLASCARKLKASTPSSRLKIPKWC